MPLHVAKTDPLEILNSRELSSVTFVRDYLQLAFDGPKLTVITDPLIVTADARYSRDTPEFCNMLLKCIGKRVRRGSLTEGDSLTLAFDNDFTIEVSLRPEDHHGPEAVIFDAGPDVWYVW